LEGSEVVIDAYTGAIEIKSEKWKSKAEQAEGDKAGKAPKPKEESTGVDDTAAAAYSSPPSSKGIDWNKVIKDLHTGKIGGDAGKLLIDFVAVILIILTISGLYLWIIPTLRKRRSARQRESLQKAAAM
jgi:uncharacterized iron-regulated membrane protein